MAGKKLKYIDICNQKLVHKRMPICITSRTSTAVYFNYSIKRWQNFGISSAKSRLMPPDNMKTGLLYLRCLSVLFKE